MKENHTHGTSPYNQITGWITLFIDDDNLNSLLAAITQVNLLCKVPYGIYS